MNTTSAWIPVLWVLATPIDGELVEMTLVSQVRRLLRPKRPIVGMRFLPPRLRTRIMNKIIIAAQKHDVFAGRRYLGPETIPAPTDALPFGRRDR